MKNATFIPQNEDPLYLNYINEVCAAHEIDLEEVRAAQHMRAIWLKNCIIIGLVKHGAGYSAIGRLMGCHKDYVARVIDHRNSANDEKMRTTYWWGA